MITAMTTEAFIRAWLDTYSRGDLDGAMACYTDDVEFEDPIFSERVTGRENLRAMFASFFSSGVTKLAFLRWSGDPSGGAAEWIWTATWGPERTFLGLDCSNRRFVTRGVSVLALRDGHICRQTDYWDARTPLRELGVLKTQSQP